MRTYKDNVIELEDGESVVIRTKDSMGEPGVELRVHAAGWHDYVGEPVGLEVMVRNRLDLNYLAMNETFDQAPNGGTIIVAPSNLVLEKPEEVRMAEAGFTKITN